jgi:prenyltransferase beta subunit
MSLRLEMLQVARLAPKLLGESTALVKNFLLSQQNEDGGFKDRSGSSDLYYTVFGLDGLQSVSVEPLDEDKRGRIMPWLASFADGSQLDFVHACCLARCRAAIGAEAVTENILRRIESFRSRDGGYNPIAGSEFGTAYGAFLALGAYQDARGDLPQRDRLIDALLTLRTKDGAWVNEHNPYLITGSTNATAAAVATLRNLSFEVPNGVGNWLLARAHPQGGFTAAPGTPIPDLLSTATALHALAGLQVPIDRVKEPCLDFIDTLWTNEGGFHGHWADDHVDCEYTFYGLLALGHLSL